MNRRILPPAVIPPLYPAHSSGSNGNEDASPGAAASAGNVLRHARRHTVSKVTFDTEVAESPRLVRKHSSLKGTCRPTPGDDHGEPCSPPPRTLLKGESKNKTAIGKHLIGCCEHGSSRDLPGRVAEACKHNTQIYVQISNPNHKENERLITAPSSKNNITIYMTTQASNSSGCGKSSLHCGTPPPPPGKVCRHVTESEACVKPEGSVQVCLVACRDECRPQSPEPDEGALFVSRVGLAKGVSVGVQVSPCAQYRLRFLPMCGCTAVEDEEGDRQFCGAEGVWFVLRLAGRWVLSQCGLAMVLTAWALLGAAAFHATEGPQEERQMRELKVKQLATAEQLVRELRHANHTTWLRAVQGQLEYHERALLMAVSAGYGEGGVVGTIWSYPGSILFAVSLLTTLGFGAPVPRTTLGRLAAVVFSAIGIPLHLLLMLNVGVLVAVKLQLLAAAWQPGVSLPRALLHCCCPSADEAGALKAADRARSICAVTPPRWLKWLPALAILLYYTLGVLVFGLGRSRPLAACMLFPLDFTAAGGVGHTPGFVRVWYAIYLETAVMLAAISVSVVQMSASKGITNLGLKLGLLTNS
ncbi:uncharacterized protein LOC134536170 [Bacillus rossius redtenbacheri]|uniref:uncharacterized protein LOC134536170 n=1 Tax=Bacillus rossius redtenbacheri TaxID=93214 RepID=UPI002FDE247C